MIKRLLGLMIAAVAGVSGSQLPEFSQQYRQRLGGALNELEQVVVRFEQDAQSVGLDSERALQELETSSHELFQKRGQSMRTHVTRYETLKQQQDAFNELDPLLRPLALTQGADQPTLAATWEAFEPAVPLTASGGAWAGASAVLGLLALLLPAKLMSALFGRRRRSNRVKQKHHARSL